MVISIQEIKLLKDISLSSYDMLALEFLFHSNKLEGSTFSLEELSLYLETNIIEGSHDVEDIQETINSVKLFDFVIDTLDEPITKTLLLEFQHLLKANTKLQEYHLLGWKQIPNVLRGVDIELAQPYEVIPKIDNLLRWWDESDKELIDVIKFHVDFEKIHPFSDGNGRVGRFIMLKQCLQNKINLFAIDSADIKKYKEALCIAQKENDYTKLSNLFIKAQWDFAEKFSFLDEIIRGIDALKMNDNLSL
ncbi:MAG: Fic family protein [Bacilli bacterium]|jgi:Fic family protein|nr:Fic family protein [Bacilli bacterium]